MDREARFDLAARALTTVFVHGSVLVAAALVIAVHGAVLALLVMVAVPFAPGLFTMLDGVGLPTGLVVVAASGAVLALLVAVRTIRNVTRGSRRRLLTRVRPAAGDGDWCVETDGTEGPLGGGLTAARLADEDRRMVVDLVGQLAARTGVPEPSVGVHPTGEPLCYTVHHDGAVILVVSRGLVETLLADELEAVLAHEVAHLANRDHRFMTWATLPLVVAERYFALTVSELGVPDSLTERRGRLAVVVLVLFLGLLGYGSAENGSFEPVVVVVAVLFLLGLGTIFPGRVFPGLLGIGLGTHLVARLGFAVISTAVRTWAELGTGLFSRGREFAADRAAARLTGDPGALASALARLDDSLAGPPPEDLRDHVHTRDALNVLPALDPERDGGGGLLATHPATETRVERLRKLEREQEAR